MAKQRTRSSNATTRSAAPRTAGAMPAQKSQAAKRAPARKGSQGMLLAIVIGVVVLAATLIIYAISSANRPIAATDRVGEGASWGAADAPVVIEDYSDFGCHFCAQFAQTTGEQLRAVIDGEAFRIHLQGQRLPGEDGIAAGRHPVLGQRGDPAAGRGRAHAAGDPPLAGARRPRGALLPVAERLLRETCL